MLHATSSSAWATLNTLHLLAAWDVRILTKLPMNLPSTLRASSRSRTLGRAPSASSIALILSSHHPHLAPLYILTTPIPATSTYVLTADSNMRVVPRMRAPAHGRRDHRLLSSPLFFFVFFNPRISVTTQVYPIGTVTKSIGWSRVKHKERFCV